jgi:hypothetical protein
MFKELDTPAVVFRKIPNNYCIIKMLDDMFRILNVFSRFVKHLKHARSYSSYE